MSNVSRIRNIGITAHIDAGKTTTTERILFYTGKNHKIGEVHDGAATMDWLPQEQERGITITSAATSCHWTSSGDDYLINIIDTPGHVDFTVEVERSLRVLDGSVIIICGVSGVQPQTETIWRQTQSYGIPNTIFINKLDRKGADYLSVIEDIAEKFNVLPLPVNYPVYEDKTLVGIIDIISQSYYSFDETEFGIKFEENGIPHQEVEEAKNKQETLFEKLSDFDDALADKFLFGKEIEPAEIKLLIRKLTISKKIIPVFCGSAFRNKGVQNLIHGICEYLPSPLEVKKETLIDRFSKEEIKDAVIECNTDDRFIGLIFKVYSDSYAGFLFYLRVYSGSIKRGMALFNLNQDKKERVMRLFKMHANRREEIEKCEAGDICACVGLSVSNTGDTISDKKSDAILKSISAFEAVISLAVEAKSVEEAKKLDEALRKISREDPSFYVSKDQETGQCVISGMGELHLDVIAQRIRSDFGVQVKTGNPQVAYRERITKTVSVQEEEVKAVDGNTVRIGLEIEVNPGENNEVGINIQQHNLKNNFIQEIRNTLGNIIKSGPVSGYPLIKTDLIIKKLTVEPENSPLTPINIVLGNVIRKLLNEAAPEMLEPVMVVEINCPKEQTGQVIADLNSRNSKIHSVSEINDYSIITGNTYLSKLFGYSTDLRSLTQGKGTYSMVFDYYDKLLN